MKKHSKGSSRLFSLALILLFGGLGFARGGSISGRVKEPSAAGPVPWASITVNAADTGLLAGAASADDRDRA